MKRYCFDIDGTICAQAGLGDYAEPTPYMDRIDKINQLYDEGNYIVYLTARGMLTCDGDVSAAYKMWYDITLQQLNDWGCKFHQLMLGKPSADYYIDDKAVTDKEFFS